MSLLRLLRSKIRGALRYNLWFEHDVVRIGGEPYLERWFVYLLGFTLRVHKFYRGDDDRAPHDHPWPFITFPLTGYWEKIWDSDLCGDYVTFRHVTPWRLHFRQSSFKHMVMGSVASPRLSDRLFNLGFETPKPFFTLVATGRKDRSWGFYPDGEYMYYRDYNAKFNATARP